MAITAGKVERRGGGSRRMGEERERESRRIGEEGVEGRER